MGIINTRIEVPQSTASELKGLLEGLLEGQNVEDPSKAKVSTFPNYPLTLLAFSFQNKIFRCASASDRSCILGINHSSTYAYYF